MKKDNEDERKSGTARKIVTGTDIVILILLVVAGITGYIAFKRSMKHGGNVNVRVDGKLVRTVSLDDDGEYRIDGSDGGYNILVVKNGSAYVKEADCPDRLCVKQGKISGEGETVICLPHKVVIEIVK